jgi:two-component system, chemotaxis family, sensor kinase CheA
MEEFYQDPALVQAFLIESDELLQAMDQDLVELENAPESEDLVDRIFRALHTIKGTAGFLGFHPIVKLGHRAEDVLNSLRRHEIHVSQRIMDALLAARDQLGKMLIDLREGGLKPQYDIEALIAELAQVQEVSGVVSERHVPEHDVRVPIDQHLGPSDKSDTAPAQRKNALATQTMRVDVRKLDELINLIGELVLERNRLLQLAKEVDPQTHAVDSPLRHSAARLSFITEELQNAALRTRMVPIDTDSAEYGFFRKQVTAVSWNG